MKGSGRASFFVILWSLTAGTAAGAAEPEDDSSPSYLRDRGAGVTTSLFGTYVSKGQWLLYPFYEYERNSNEEYHGSELGFTGDLDYLGESTVHEAGLFVAYGLADDLAVELEGILYEDATLERAPDDTTTGMPDRLEESGFGSVEAQLRWRFRRERSDHRSGSAISRSAFPSRRTRC